MAVLTIRNVDDSIKRLLRIRAAQHGVSMEEEARCILRQALVRISQSQPLGQRLMQRFAEAADAAFELPPRQVLHVPQNREDVR